MGLIVTTMRPMRCLSRPFGLPGSPRAADGHTRINIDQAALFLLFGPRHREASDRQVFT